MKTKKKSDYKTERGWLNHLWKVHKDEIQAKTPEVDKKIFIARIKELQGEDMAKTGRKSSEEKAVKKLLRTEEYLSKADRLSENALNAIRKDKEALRALRKGAGWKDKLDPEKLRWDNKNKMYVYEGTKGNVYIDFTNSPKSIKIMTENINPVTRKSVRRKR